MSLALALLWLSGCLLFAGPPSGFDEGGRDSGQDCVEAECAPFRCAGSRCPTYCFLDSQCQDGLICDDQACVEPCGGRPCPGNFACETVANVCRDRCYIDSHCRDDAQCCSSAAHFRGDCNTIGTCY